MSLINKLAKAVGKYFLPILVLVAALSISGSAAIYSITGLSKLFAGASIAVIIMAASLEGSKLIIAAVLHKYWNTLGRALRIYLTTAVVVLIIITSIGIYGFLSAAYFDTYKEYSNSKSKVEFLDSKVEFFEEDLSFLDKELESSRDNINTLSKAKSASIQVRDTTSATGFRNTVSTSELRLAQSRISQEEVNRDRLYSRKLQLLDSVNYYKTLKLEVESSSNVASELGPLEYLSDVTGKDMNDIINILIIIIMLVFDPLAVSLVVTASTLIVKLSEDLSKSDDSNVSKTPFELYNEVVSEIEELDANAVSEDTGESLHNATDIEPKDSLESVEEGEEEIPKSKKEKLIAMVDKIGTNSKSTQKKN